MLNWPLRLPVNASRRLPRSARRSSSEVAGIEPDRRVRACCLDVHQFDNALATQQLPGPLVFERLNHDYLYEYYRADNTSIDRVWEYKGGPKVYGYESPEKRPFSIVEGCESRAFSTLWALDSAQHSGPTGAAGPHCNWMYRCDARRSYVCLQAWLDFIFQTEFEIVVVNAQKIEHQGVRKLERLPGFLFGDLFVRVEALAGCRNRRFNLRNAVACAWNVGSR